MKILQRYLSRATAVALALTAGVAAGQADYQATVLGDSPICYWRFSETDVVTFQVVATNLGTAGANSDGTYNGDQSTMKGQPGVLPNDAAAHFDGSSQDVLIPANSTAASLAPPFTVEAWVKPDEVVPGGTFCPLASIDRAAGASGWIIYESGSNWNFRTGDAAGYEINILATGTVLTNTWYHLMATYDGTNAIFYVDGSLAGTGTTNAYTPNTINPMGIGARGDGYFFFPGSLNDVAVYPSVLPANVAAAHYAAATTNAAGYAAQILASNPVGFWRLDEPIVPLPVAANSGTLGAADDGSYVFWSATELDLDSPTYPGFATNNTVLELDGTNGYVAFPALKLNTNTVTVEAWVNLNGVQSPFSGLVFSRNSAIADGMSMGGDGKSLGYTWNDQSGSTFNWGSGLVVPLSEWAYVALAIDPNEARLFLGTSAGWTAATNAIAHDNEGFMGPGSIGRDPTPGRFINGEMDDAAIYNKTLTEGQLHTHALAGFGGENPPALVTDPPVLTPTGVIYVTTPFLLIADAFGQPPLSFQWCTNGTPIPGATNLSYGKLNAAIGDSGNYDVIVTNAYGALTSSIVTVSVLTGPPVVQTDVSPLLTEVPAGVPVTFSVTAAGPPPFYYQWSNGSSAIVGATNSSYTFNALPGPSSYSVVISNSFGSTPGSTALVLGLTNAPPVVNFTGNNASDWVLNEGTMAGTGAVGPPALSGNVLEITDGNTYEGQSAFFDTPQYIGGFVASFAYTEVPGNSYPPADGITFCIQNSPAGTGATGAWYTGLGYEGITNSAAFEMNNYSGDRGGAGIQFGTDGLTPTIWTESGLYNSSLGPYSSTAPVNITSAALVSGDPIYVQLYYSQNLLSVWLTDATAGTTFTTSYNVTNLPAIVGGSSAFVGFTGATAGYTSIQTVSNFVFSYTTPPILSLTPGTAGSVVVSWPVSVSTLFVLQQTTALNELWSNVNVTPEVVNSQNQVTLTPGTSTAFYRLTLQ